MTFKRILCPIDFSDSSRTAMQVAAQLSKEGNGELILIHVWHPPYTFGPEAVFTPDLIATMKRDAEQGLLKWKIEAEGLRGSRVTAILEMGPPWDLVIEAAKKDPVIDLIVIGTHGRTGLKRVLLGSVAEKIVRHAPCPVLVARSRH